MYAQLVVRHSLMKSICKTPSKSRKTIINWKLNFGLDRYIFFLSILLPVDFLGYSGGIGKVSTITGISEDAVVIVTLFSTTSRPSTKFFILELCSMSQQNFSRFYTLERDNFDNSPLGSDIVILRRETAEWKERGVEIHSYLQHPKAATPLSSLYSLSERNSDLYLIHPRTRICN